MPSSARKSSTSRRTPAPKTIADAGRSRLQGPGQGGREVTVRMPRGDSASCSLDVAPGRPLRDSSEAGADGLVDQLVPRQLFRRPAHPGPTCRLRAAWSRDARPLGRWLYQEGTSLRGRSDCRRATLDVTPHGRLHRHDRRRRDLPRRGRAARGVEGPLRPRAGRAPRRRSRCARPTMRRSGHRDAACRRPVTAAARRRQAASGHRSAKIIQRSPAPMRPPTPCPAGRRRR